MIVNHFNGGQIRWTTSRVKLIAQYAAEGNSAAVIAKRLGLGPGKSNAVAKAARRNNIKLDGKPGRPRKSNEVKAKVSVRAIVPMTFNALVKRFACRLEITPCELLERLTAGLQKQGDTAVIDMLLDAE